MAGRAVSRNNVIAGVFVVVSLILAVLISGMVSGAQKRLARTVPYFVRFTLQQGAAGLKADSPVTLGGQQIGRVTRVDFERGADGLPTAVLVRVAVRSDIPLFEDAGVFLVKPLLGTLSTVNVAWPGDGSKVGSPQHGDPRLQADEVVQGAIAPPSFLAEAGYGPEQTQQVQQILERLDRVSARVDRELDPMVSSVKKALDDLGQVASELRTKAPDWESRIDSVLAKTDQAADQFNATLKSADETVRSVRSAIDENRPELDRIIASVDKAAAKLSSESVDQLNATLASAREGAGEFASAARQFRALLEQEQPNIERILGNLRLAADQIKLTGIEVRRNPWRLLYQPKTKELESELFYDAARSYATAVSDLRAASEALESVRKSAAGEMTTADRETIQHITTRLDEAFKRYEIAEQNLLKEMTQKR